MVIRCSKIQFFVLFSLDSCYIMIIVPQFIVHNMKNGCNGVESQPS